MMNTEREKEGEKKRSVWGSENKDRGSNDGRFRVSSFCMQIYIYVYGNRGHKKGKGKGKGTKEHTLILDSLSFFCVFSLSLSLLSGDKL